MKLITAGNKASRGLSATAEFMFTIARAAVANRRYVGKRSKNYRDVSKEKMLETIRPGS